MLFNSFEYLFLFLPCVFVIYFFLNKLLLFKTANFFLFTASLFFYGCYKLDYIGIIIISILFNYLISLFLLKNYSKNKRKFIIYIGIIGNICILYSSNFFNILTQEFGSLGINTFSTFNVLIPLGISFFTLQEIAYLIDCYKGNAKKYNILDFSLFVCFFPQFMSGPTINHKEIIPQFSNIENKSINNKNIYFAFFMITIGLLKIVILSNNFDSFTDRIIFYNRFFDSYICWFYSLIKLFQIYFDLSGYCDIAIGSAKLFNIKLPENFNSPFKAKNISDFWNRWNITVINFFKEYILIPSNCKKKSTIRTYFNILLIFVLYSLWMGLQTSYILYGILNGIFICINKFWQKFHIKMPQCISTTITLFSLIITIPFIFTQDINQAFEILKLMLNFDFPLNNISFEKLNIVFADLRYPPYKFLFKINYLMLIIVFYLILFSKNSMELSEFYVKSNKKIYTFIVLIAFIVSTLFIEKSTKFLYFVF